MSTSRRRCLSAWGHSRHAPSFGAPVSSRAAVRATKRFTLTVFRKGAGWLRARAWVPFDWQNDWGRVALRSLGQRRHTSLVQCDGAKPSIIWCRKTTLATLQSTKSQGAMIAAGFDVSP